jgi:hypothetical protein
MRQTERPVRVEDYRALQEAIFGEGRRWIIALDVAGNAGGFVEALRNMGAGPCLAIGASRGSGPLPDPASGPEAIVLDVSADSMMEGIWAAQKALASLPSWAIEQVEAFDPDGEARVLGTIFDDGAPVGGRTKFGRRLPQWRALEDKTVVDAIWRELEVAHSPYRVVPVELNALLEASDALDRGDGVVWAGDARSGAHGGAEFTRWVRTRGDAERVFERFAKFCDEARVMPFLEGIPCSIHGIVFPERVVAGRPCEMLVLRRAEQNSFQYATAASFWDPPPEFREEMRALAKRVGAYLRDKVGFRGMFTIDGIMTDRGFLPTELNPRFGGAVGLLVNGLDLGIKYIDVALMEGLEVDWNPENLERLVIEHADANRSGRSNVVVPGKPGEPLEWALKEADGCLEFCDPESSFALVTGSRGEATAGTFIRIVYNPELIATGQSVAPIAARVLNHLSDQWDLGLPELTPAADLFSGR